MPFKRIDTKIKDLCIIEPSVFKDERGYFKETYNKNSFEEIGLKYDFLQDNLSFSSKGILRGLHLQAEPFAQGKLVSVLKGVVQDVAVDLRKNSPTYGEHFSIILSDENHRMFFVPPGFAHGFLVLSDFCHFHYKCTNVYDKSSELGLMWNDPNLGIKWELDEVIISEKDTKNQAFNKFNSPF